MSSPSPVTDGAAVWVMTGTGILKAFDFNGTELWMRDIQKDYGRFGLQWGYASSPLLHEDALYVQVLHGMQTDDPSYLLRIDKTTGRRCGGWSGRRRRDRNRPTPTPRRSSYGTARRPRSSSPAGTWSPATIRRPARSCGGCTASIPRIAATIASSPRRWWRAALLIAPTRESPMLAIRPGGRGDVTRSHVAWSFTRGGPDVPTPVSDGQYVYVVNDRGIVHCLDVKTGATVYGRSG